MYVMLDKDEHEYISHCIGYFGDWLEQLIDDGDLRDCGYDDLTLKITIDTLDKLTDNEDLWFDFDDKNVSLCGHVLSIFSYVYESEKNLQMNNHLLDQFIDITKTMKKNGEL